MAEKPSVLIVHNHYQLPGGEDTVVANERRMLEERGHKVVMYTRSNNEIRTMKIWQKLLLPIVAIFNIRTYREVRRLIRTEEIDIVHVHNTLMLISPAVYYAALSRGVPVVQTVHNFRLICPGATFYRDGHVCEECVTKGLKCAVKYKCYRNSQMQTLLCVIGTKIHRLAGIYKKIAYICLTEFNKKKLLQLELIAEKQVFVKPNFGDKERKIIPYEKRKNQYVFVGRLEKLKGVDILMDSWRLMQQSRRLVLCGTGPMEGWCREYVKKHHLENVEIRGFVHHDEVMEIISESKALLFPTQWYEGFPMVIVESYSCGTPVVGSDLGNTADLIQNNKTGYLFLHDSIQDLYRKIKKADGRNMVEDCMNYYRDQFDEEGNYKILLKIYAKIIQKEQEKR